MTEYKKKLIEVALPLEALNQESAREKSIRHGHPSTLHLWWARRPLATCRAVLFASLVDDPSAHPETFPDEDAQDRERQRLFRIIEELVKWENSDNEEVLNAAREEILRSCGGLPPSVLDPFSGGGSIPLEAQRLGLQAFASDLNPVAVLIAKALTQSPAVLSGFPPVCPTAQKTLSSDRKGAVGLAEDVRYYGEWMRQRAYECVGNLYPKVQLPKDLGGGETEALAWLWARTVRCPNPACGADMPVVRSFELSTKKGSEAWVEPEVDHLQKSVAYRIRTGAGMVPEGTKQRGKTKCLFCGMDNISDSQLREQSRRFGIGQELMAVVVSRGRSRSFLPASCVKEDESSFEAGAEWLEKSLPANPRWFSPPAYGMDTYESLFSARQIATLTKMSDLVNEARQRIEEDALVAMDDGWPNGQPRDRAVPSVDKIAKDYAKAVAMYLAFAVDKMTTTNSSLCGWQTNPTRLIAVYGRQAMPMIWDWAEANPFSGAGVAPLLWTGQGYAVVVSSGAVASIFS